MAVFEHRMCFIVLFSWKLVTFLVYCFGVTKEKKKKTDIKSLTYLRKRIKKLQSPCRTWTHHFEILSRALATELERHGVCSRRGGDPFSRCSMAAGIPVLKNVRACHMLRHLSVFVRNGSQSWTHLLCSEAVPFRRLSYSSEWKKRGGSWTRT